MKPFALVLGVISSQITLAEAANATPAESKRLNTAKKRI